MNTAASDKVIAVARSWLGTPYHDQASLKGVGCDCLGLARGVWREVVGPEPFPIPPYSRDWGETGLREVLAEGGLASWLVTDEPEPMSRAELRAEVMGGEVLPAYGLETRASPLPDPAAPDYLDQVRRRLIGIGEAGPAPLAQDALDRVLREERARMTERMVAQLARGAHG